MGKGKEGGVRRERTYSREFSSDEPEIEFAARTADTEFSQ